MNLLNRDPGAKLFMWKGYMTQTHLRDKQKSSCSVSDGFHIFFIVAAVEAHQQVVGNANDTHQGKEGDDPFSKQVTWGAVQM